MTMTKEQKLLALLLCDIHKALNIKDSLNTDLISDAITGGHDWALNWELKELSTPIPDNVCTFVCDVLEMYSAMEFSYEKLSEEERQRLLDEAYPFGDDVLFKGFDGNNEYQYLSVCRFLIKKMGKFTEFTDRADLNSHHRMVDTYQRMLDVFLPNKKLSLSVEDMIAINRAQIHPENR